MAKKLINSRYSFDVAAGTVTIHEYIHLADLFLITNVTTNDIIYNFADVAAGGSVEFDRVEEKTTITLSMDVNALGTMSNDDELQIIIDEGEAKMDISDSFLDPVHKIRVSQPENLIDTDFEYGLQPTKWETLELSNNVPSFYISDGDLSLQIVTEVTTLTGSDIVTVYCREEHGLPVGTPIDVQGLSSRTAEGKFLIATVPTANTFTYRANASQNTTGEIGSIYTTITPGTFYTGSQIPFDPAAGVVTDEGDPNSNITVTTEDPHGFTHGNQFYLLNSVGGKALTFNFPTGDTAPDGRPYVDPDDTLSFTVNPTYNLTETKQYRSRWSHKFTETDVNTSSNTIRWDNHQLKNNDCVLYMPSIGDTSIGGLGTFWIYYVIAVDANNISLTNTRNGSAISFTNTGSFFHGRHHLHLAYEIKRNYYPRRSNYCYQYTSYAQSGNGSGWDLVQTFDGGYGLGYTAGQTVRWVPFATTNPYHYSTQQYYLGRYAFGPYGSSNFTNVYNQNTGVNNPEQYNIFEDFNRFMSGSFTSYVAPQNNGQIRVSKYYYTNPYGGWNGTYNFYPSDKTEFFIPMVEDEEGDSFYVQDHGLTTGDNVSITTLNGSYGTYTGVNYLQQHTGNTSYNNTTALSNVSDGNYTVDVLSENRFRLSGVRLSSAIGQYEFEGTKRNSLANSFWLPTHGLNDGTEVTFSTKDAGVVPTSNSGEITPNSGSSADSTNVISWNVLNNSIDSYLTANTTGRQDIVTATNENSTRVFNSGVSSGLSSMNYYDMYYTTNSVWYSNYGSLNPPSSNLNVGNLNSSRPWNMLTGTVLADRNNMIVATDWEPNSTVPYYFWTRESNRQNSAEYWYGYLRDGFNFPTQGSMAVSSELDNQTFTVNGTDYRWSGAFFKHVRAGAPSTVYFNGHFQNITNWNFHNQNTSISRATDNNSYFYSYWGGQYQWKDIVEFGLVFMLDEADTSFSSNADFTNLMQQMLTDFDTNYVYPALTVGALYDVNVASVNRISLESGGVPVNITNNGTENFEFITKAQLGVVDGTYTTNNVTEDTITFAASAKIFGAIIELDATTVTADNIIKVANGGTHTLITGTQVTYSDEANPTLANLTTGNNYYVVAIDDEHIALCQTESDAINKDNFIDIDPGTGIHKITTQSISGISEAVGDVAITSGSNVIKGNTTLFKRYFKTGDTVYIKDASVTPGELIERKVTSIADDEIMTVDRQMDFTSSATKHFLETKVYAKPDGYAVHRPFDGGVEIAAGTSPYSQITRQTRKYFRYQSGKGIQTSLAINFNPPVTLETLTGTGGLTATNETYNVTNENSNAWVFAEEDINNPVITVYRGSTYTFELNASGHPFYLSTDDGTNYVSGNYVGEYTTGVTGSRTEVGTVTFVVPSDAPDILYYFCANHGSMFGVLVVQDFPANQATATTKYPHRLSVGSAITVKDASDNAFNGNHTINEIVDDFTFKYGMVDAPSSSIPTGIIKYNLNGYSGAYTRAGMFDQQNGFFFEFDGTTLYACRRSSTTQLSGTATLVNNSGRVTGDSKTNFTGQLSVGDYVVLRGQSYKITKIAGKAEMYVQPQFKGLSTTGAIITKTEDVKVPQQDWNIDTCDGNGPHGFLLDINKIQMAYMDYSWYGAGKIRFGFKDMKGHVKYVHEFIHNNRLDEAYMRSGNLPAKYEIENGESPSYAPTLFHWGTSVIMDGTFDDDKAYLFTAPSKSLSFTNGESSSINTNGNSSLYWQYNRGTRLYDFWVRIPFAAANSDSFYSGLRLWTVNGELNGDEIDFTGFSGSTFYVYIYVTSSRSYPAVYPNVTSGTAVSLGSDPNAVAEEEVNLGTDVIPLVSLRLAPSVDSNLSGDLGERDIINRMQLQLNEVGLILTHDCEVKLILNGDLSTIEWENVKNPSLSQLIKHESGDTVTGGTEVFSFRAAGGSTDANGKRLSNASNFSLGDIIDLGNSILGGNGTFPNGPDVLTVAIQVVDTGGIGASQPFGCSGRITWSESQA